jgi:hypothetical protein
MKFTINDSSMEVLFMSCVLSIKVRVMKSVYFAHALAYRSV